MAVVDWNSEPRRVAAGPAAQTPDGWRSRPCKKYLRGGRLWASDGVSGGRLDKICGWGGTVFSCVVYFLTSIYHEVFFREEL